MSNNGSFPSKGRKAALLHLFTFLVVALLMVINPPPAAAQTAPPVSALVADPSGVSVRVRGAWVKVPSAWREYMVRIEYQPENNEREDYRRVILYRRVGSTNCLQSPCWNKERAFSMTSNIREGSFKRADLKELLITSWGFDPNNGNSKGGAPYTDYQIERISVDGKSGIKLSFISDFGAGSTVITLLPK